MPAASGSNDFLGNGTFGIVRKVQTPSGPVAQKELIITGQPEVDAPRIRRFKREVEYQTKISHENVVPILEANLDAPQPWFRMPLALYPLTPECINNLNDRERVVVTRMIFDGIEAIHDAGKIHRDIKPGNILVFTDPNNYRYCAISDFGMVAENERGESTVLTSAGQGLGTPYYMAPECLTDAQNATIRADIYSAGVLLLYIYQQELGTPYSQRDCDHVIKPIVSKATAQLQEHRFGSINEMRIAFNSKVSPRN